MPSNQELIRRAGSAIDKAALGGERLLSPDQGRAFVDEVLKIGETLQHVRTETLTTPTKKINKMGIKARGLRAGAENTAPTKQKPFTFGQVVMTPVKLDLAYELTDEAMDDNIEQEQFRTHAANLTTSQIGTDLNDIMWNGDVTDYSAAATQLNGALAAGALTMTVDSAADFPSASSGFGFLLIGSERISYTAKTGTTFTGLTRAEDEDDSDAATGDVNHADNAAVTFVPDALFKAYDGVIKLVNSGGNVIDPSAIGDGGMSLDLFNAMLDAIPSRFIQRGAFGDSWRWHANRKTIRAWVRAVSARMTASGDRSIEGEKLKPFGYAWQEDEHIADGTVVFGPQKAIIQAVRTNNIRFRSTNQGVDAVSRDITYYKWSTFAQVKLDEPTAFAIAESISIAIA